MKIVLPEAPKDERPLVVVDMKEKRRQFGKYVHCNCMATISDPETELLECKHCGRFWTAYNWIKHIFSGVWRLEWRYNDLKLECEQLQIERDALKKEVISLKGKKKRLLIKQPNLSKEGE